MGRNSTMNIPNNLYVLDNQNWKTLTGYISPDVNNEKTKTVKLPSWLTQSIQKEIKLAREDGAAEVRKQIRNALRI
jgi:hypothetical protein